MSCANLDKNFGCQFLNLERWGRAPAVLNERGECTTYEGLAAIADSFADQLGPKRKLVAIGMDKSVDAIASYLGALRAGHPVLLVSPTASAARDRILQTYRPDAWFVSGNGGWQPQRRSEDDGLHPQLALLLCTSGTTGASKLVRLSHRALDSNASSIVQYLGLNASDRAIAGLPLYFSYGLSVLHSHLHAGASVILTDHSAGDPEFWRVSKDTQVTSFAGVPHSYDLIDASGLRDSIPSSVSTLTQAGGRMVPERVASWARWASETNRRFFVMYGQTEAAPRMAYLPPELVETHPECIGIPIPGGDFTLLHDDGSVISVPDTTGQLVYSGDNVMMGYAVTRSDLAEPPQGAILHTGDMAQRSRDGLYKVVGRRSRFVKIFGLRISLDEIEADLHKLGIASIVTGDDDFIAVAYLVGPSHERVLRLLLSRHNVPSTAFEIQPIRELPLLESGKPDYQSVLMEARARRADAKANAQDGFSTIFATLLTREHVAKEDSFVSLNGDSLSYVQVLSEIERLIGRVPENWQTLTVAELDAMKGSGPNVGGWLRPFGSEVVIRALAILAVVLRHSGLPLIAGGSDALLMLAGYNLARFNSHRLLSGCGWSVVWRFVRRIVGPYYIILLIYAAIDKKANAYSFLLIGNLLELPKGFLTPYWFIEALTQILFFVALLFSLQAVRVFAERRPWSFATNFVLAALAVRIALFELLGPVPPRYYSTEFVLPLFALGWAMFFAEGNKRKVFCLLAAAVLGLADAGFLGGNAIMGAWPRNVGLQRLPWIIGTPLLILFIPKLSLPPALGSMLTRIAAISFTIYLVHTVPVHFMARVENAPPILAATVGVLFAFFTVYVRNSIVKWLVTLSFKAKKLQITKSLNSQLFSRLTAVPEPATWAKMLLGFSLMGSLVRRRRPRTLRDSPDRSPDSLGWKNGSP